MTTPKRLKPQIAFVTKGAKEKAQIILGAALRPETIYVTTRDVAIPHGDLRKKTAPWHQRGMVAKGDKFLALAIEVDGGHMEIRIRPFERDADLIGPDHDLYYELLPTLDVAGPLSAGDTFSTLPAEVTPEAVIDALIAAGELTMEQVRMGAALVQEEILAKRRAAEVEAATPTSPPALTPNLAIAPPASSASASIATK